jgi:aromatic-L-amino-acid decarboxylase
MNGNELDMSPEDFRRHGREVLDWIARYWEGIEERPVLAQVERGEVRKQLPLRAPEQAEPFDSVLSDLEALVLPGLTHWQSPSFFAFFPANSSGPSVLGELLSAGLGVQGMTWLTSPACTELEMQVMDWLVEALGLPAEYRFEGGGGGVIQDSASSANLCAVLAARERATGFESNRVGCDGSLVAYVSDETHFSVEKAVRIAGIGSANLRRVATDASFAMRADHLAELVAVDRAAGRRPFFVCATVGTTSSQAMDPLGAIGELCRRESMWLHVDAAMAGSAALCPELRHLQAGVELADSYCFDPHKWLFVNFDCTCMWVRDRRCLIDSLALTSAYVPGAVADEQTTDYRDWQVPLGRRFRALKLWMVLRHYGLDGLRTKLRRHVELAHELRSWVEQDGRFEVVAPTPLNLVCFRHRDGEAANQSLLDAVNRGGRLFMSSTRLDGELTLRLCVGQTSTERRHVRAAWQSLQQAAAGLARD